MAELDDPEKQEKRNAQLRIDRRNELEDIMWILSTVQGRRFYWRMLTACHIYETSYTGNQNQTFYREGERNIGLMLIHEMHQSDPTAYLKCVKENVVREEING